jgi:hypothetical protein
VSSKQIRYPFLVLGGRTRRLSVSLLHFGQGGAVGLGVVHNRTGPTIRLCTDSWLSARIGFRYAGFRHDSFAEIRPEKVGTQKVGTQKVGTR